MIDAPSGLCSRCGENEATTWFGDMLALTHAGGSAWCSRCVVEVQVEGARESAEALPGLELRLAGLGGVAGRVCSCRPGMLTVQECPVHGTVDYGARFVEANAGRGENSEAGLWASIGRRPSREET